MTRVGAVMLVSSSHQAGSGWLRCRMIASTTSQSKGREVAGRAGTSRGGVAGSGGGGSSSTRRHIRVGLSSATRYATAAPKECPISLTSSRSRASRSRARPSASVPASTSQDVSWPVAPTVGCDHPIGGGQRLDHHGPVAAVLAERVQQHHDRRQVAVTNPPDQAGGRRARQPASLRAASATARATSGMTFASNTLGTM